MERGLLLLGNVNLKFTVCNMDITGINPAIVACFTSIPQFSQLLEIFY